MYSSAASEEPPPPDLFPPPPPGQYFSAEELQRLSALPPPTDYYSLGCSGTVPSGAIPVAQAVPADSATPATQPSLAETTYDHLRGVSSCDVLLHMDQSGDEILKYLNTYNTRPLQAVRVHGHHQETRTRTVSSTDSNGNRTERTETYSVTVTDFDYKVDLSHFIFPFGFIQTDNGQSVEEAIQDFLGDANGLKKLTMEKVVDFDFEHLWRMVNGYVRSLGWRRGLTVSFPRANYRAKVWKKGCVYVRGERGEREEAGPVGLLGLLASPPHPTPQPFSFARAGPPCGRTAAAAASATQRKSHHTVPTLPMTHRLRSLAGSSRAAS
jgi:hypothetical protein